MLRADTYAPSYNTVPGQVLPYRGTPRTVGKMIELALGLRGERSIIVRRHAEQLVNLIRPKDYSSEIIAIYQWWCRAPRYTRDPVHVELLKDPELMVTDAAAGRLVADCDEQGLGIATDCLCIGAQAQFVTVGFRPRVPEGPEAHTHVLCRAQDPRTRIWWVLDPVAGRRTSRMLSRVRQARIYPIEPHVALDPEAHSYGWSN